MVTKVNTPTQIIVLFPNDEVYEVSAALWYYIPSLYFSLELIAQLPVGRVMSNNITYMNLSSYICH